MLEILIVLLAGSLDQLQDQVTNDINQANSDKSYRAELIDYITSHNMTFYTNMSSSYNVNTMDLSYLENLVKTQMTECANGTHDQTLAYWNNPTTKAEKFLAKAHDGLWLKTLQAMNGDCDK